MKLFPLRAFVVLTSLLSTLTDVGRAADHLDAPTVRLDGATDINDVYLFRSPVTASNTVMIMTVNPFAGVVSGTQFGAHVAYEFLVDNNGDALPDITYAASFGAAGADGRQPLTISRSGNSAYASGMTDSDVATSSGGSVRAGVFDDPFFFDLNGFRNGLAFTGNDTFKGANIGAIILELPSSELGGPNIGIWARTVVGGNQIDRMGRPAINTVAIPTARKDEFNVGRPHQDQASFGGDVRAAVTSLSGDPAHAVSLTNVLLPDILTFDTTNSGGFLNGRRLADDVIDAELSLLTNGAFTAGDGVPANDLSFRNSFPYLAAPHAIVPEPSTSVLVAWGIGLVVCCRRKIRRYQ